MDRRRALPIIMLALTAGCGGSSSSDAPQQPAGPVTHAVAVHVTGLEGAVGLTLSNNGTDQLSIDADGVATFTTRVAEGGAWNVVVSVPPQCPARKCSVTNPSGAGMTRDEVAEVTCVAPTVTLFTTSWGDDPDWIGITDNPLNAMIMTRKVTWSGLAGLNAFTSEGNAAVDPTRGLLYVADASARRVLVYPNAFSMIGNLAPTRTITLPAGSSVGGVAVSTKYDRLYVSAGGRVLQFNGASTAHGTPDPDVVVTVAGASALELSESSDRLFVADPNGRRVVTFDSVSTLSTGSTAARVLTFTSLTPYAIRYDRCSTKLFVGSRDANAGGNGLVVFYNSRVSGTVNEDIVSDARLQGGGFMMLALDGVGNLYAAADSATSIRVFANPGVWYGAINPTPVKTLPTPMNKGYGLEIVTH